MSQPFCECPHGMFQHERKGGFAACTECRCIVDRNEKAAAPSVATVVLPPPEPRTGRACWDFVLEDLQDSMHDHHLHLLDAVLADMRERDDFGFKKYKQRLMPNDGRSPLTDGYQEALDGVVYAAKACIERYVREFGQVPSWGVDAFRNEAWVEVQIYRAAVRLCMLIKSAL